MDLAKPIKCSYCSEELFFDKRILSQSSNFSDGIRNEKPLEATQKVHQCQNRGWSIRVRCKYCDEAIQFHNSVTSPRGKKIPHGTDLKPHNCVRRLR